MPPRHAYDLSTQRGGQADYDPCSIRKTAKDLAENATDVWRVRVFHRTLRFLLKAAGQTTILLGGRRGLMLRQCADDERSEQNQQLSGFPGIESR